MCLPLNPQPAAVRVLRPRAAAWIFAVVGVLLQAGAAWSQFEFERPPIQYGQGRTVDPVARLQDRLDTGELKLEYDEQFGYLPAVLRLLKIPESSQVLVASKTSFQLRRISPQHPRALYFNDENHVGWVQGGDVVEIMSTDPWQGEIFYTLSQNQNDQPRFVRDSGQCLACHASSRTQGVPGGLVRSTFVDRGGQPNYGLGTYTTDHTSPFDERWGGWYVTGTHGAMRHMGNVFAEGEQSPESLDRDAGANQSDLADRFDVSKYRTPHSDVVALLVLEHQTQMQNHLTHASYEARAAAHHDGIMNAALDRPASHVSESAERRVASVGDKLLRYMLFADEFRLTDRVSGTSGYAEEFEALGPRDSRGRSLRDFDLETRLFKYPCSYMIYSPAFDKLPKSVKSYVTARLHDVLVGKDASEDFGHLTAADRKAILEILTETKPQLWQP